MDVQYPLVLLTNGRIHTLDPSDSIVDALGVRDGRIAFAGRRADVKLVLIPREELERLLGEARDAGFQACVHAIGDRANTLALGAMERVGVAGRRFGIEHGQVLTPSDVPRFTGSG